MIEAFALLGARLKNAVQIYNLWCQKKGHKLTLQYHNILEICTTVGILLNKTIII